MLRTIQRTAVLLLLCLILAPAPAQANWNRVMRFFGEFWSDGYHSKGDYWNQPPRHHAPRLPYQPYYPAMHQPTPAMDIPVESEVIEAAPLIMGVPSN